jgi:3-hydroxyacyl-[acyl-carrier-protein] dehydratase
MLLNNLFIVEKSVSEGNSLRATLRIRREHPIFEGHFPEVPILPGVCMIQLIKELVSVVNGTNWFLHEGSNIKFLAPVNPQTNDVIEAAVTMNPEAENRIDVNSTLSFGDTVFFKMKASLKRA